MKKHIDENLNCSIKVFTKAMNVTSYKQDQIKKKYLPYFRKKLKLNHTTPITPSQDRLSQLTTHQIDRLIQFDKIQQLLTEKKHNTKPIYISQQISKNKHMNIYESSYLAKINRMAIKMNVRRLRSVQFDENQIQNKTELFANAMNRLKNANRFQKKYSCDLPKKNMQTQEDDVKSIEQVRENIQQFEDKLQNFKVNLTKNESLTIYKRKDKKSKKQNGIVENRWFPGMSKLYIPQQQYQEPKQIHRCLDIQFKNKTHGHWKLANTKFGKLLSTNYSIQEQI